jgi:hypothetical protein
MVNKAKTYSPEVLNTIKKLGVSLQEIQQRGNVSLKHIATNSGLSINSIKSIFKGATANIASYDSLARALGTSLIEVARNCHMKEANSVKTEAFPAQV